MALITAKIMLIAIGWNSLASTPSKLKSGINTTKIMVAAKNTGRATSLPASKIRSRAVNVLSWRLKCLNMFSTITTEPSTSMPIATARPPSDIKLAETLSHTIIIKAIAMAIGMDMSTNNVARRFIRNRASTTTIKIKARVSAFTTVFTALVIRSAWS